MRALTPIQRAGALRRRAAHHDHERSITMYVIRGKYTGCPWENIDEFETREEAERMLDEYIMAYGAGWRFAIKTTKGA